MFKWHYITQWCEVDCDGDDDGGGGVVICQKMCYGFVSGCWLTILITLLSWLYVSIAIAILAEGIKCRKNGEKGLSSV